MPDPSDHHAGRRRAASVAVWAAVALAGVTLLPLPFTGDQALYSMYGHRLARGAVLYRDVWDVKQPAIMWFYAVAGRLFGFTEVGSHLLVVLWSVGGALVAVRAWRGQLTTPWAVTAIPLLTAGLTLASARTIDIGQVEQLVGVPLLASWWLTQDPRTGTARGRGRLVAAGALGALVALFKHLYLGIVVVLVVLALVRLARRSGRRPALAAGSWWVLGFGAALSPAALQVVVTHQVRRVWWTFVTVPGELRAQAPPELHRLVVSVGRAGVIYLPLLVLAAIGSRRAWHPAHRAATVDMLVWVLVGGVTLLVQLWWPYQQLLVLTPLALLATHGVDALAAPTGRWRAGGRRRVAVAAVVLTGLVAVAPLAVRVRQLARHGLALRTADRRALRVEIERAEALAQQTAPLFHAPAARAGDVLVLGNPIHQLRAGRDQAGAIHGWIAEMETPRLWAETVEAVARPTTAYVGIDDDAAPYVRDRAPALTALLASRYRALGRIGGLEWFERIDP